jgi:hypothetical protein
MILNIRIINMVMGYLDRGFQDMMLVLKARMGDSWAPSNPGMNPCEFFWRGYLKELVNKPLPANFKDLRERIAREFSNLPEAMVAKAVFAMKKRSLKLLKTGGEAFEG